jgi:hypothetical protein
MREWTVMRPVGLEFLKEAPLRVAVEAMAALPGILQQCLGDARRNLETLRG